jgi:sugar phosphate isomerase/epimerase
VAVAVDVGRFGIATGSYVAERDDWPKAIARARAERWRWIELTALRGRLVSLLELLDRDADSIAGFERVSVHAPAAMAESPADVVATLEPFDFDVVLHPDVYGAEPACARLGTRAVFENMDVAKRSGRDVVDLGAVLASFTEAGFCLDVAHVWTNDTTLRLGHDLLDAFGDRLRQLHVSGIEPDGTHRTTTAADLELYEPLLVRCGHVPWLLEAELEDAD